MTKRKRTQLSVFEDTKLVIQQLRLDFKVKTEEDVVKKLIDYYRNNDPLVFEAMELIRKIRENN